MKMSKVVHTDAEIEGTEKVFLKNSVTLNLSK